eukprot:123973_1
MLTQLNEFTKSIKIKSESITKIKYKSYQEAETAIKNKSNAKQTAQHTILTFLSSQPVIKMIALVEYSWNKCVNKEDYKCNQENISFSSIKNNTYTQFIQRALLELPIAIVPIPVDEISLKQPKDTKCEKYVLLLSKPPLSNNYEECIITFLMEIICQLNYNKERFNEYMLELLEAAKNTLLETEHRFGANMISRLAEQLFSDRSLDKHHIYSMTTNQRNTLYNLQNEMKSEEQILEEAADLLQQEEDRLLLKLSKLEKRQKRSAHASRANKRSLTNKIANVEERVAAIQTDKNVQQRKKYKHIKKKYMKEIKKVCKRVNKGNSKGAFNKYDFETQEWVLFVLDSGNFSTCHDRKLANRIIEKNDMTGTKNTLKQCLSIIDIKLYIEKHYKTKGNLSETKRIYQNIKENIWDLMDGEVFENRIKSTSTISEYYDNRNPNSIQGKRLLKMNKTRSKNLIATMKKGKRARRFQNINHWYCLNDIQNVNKYYYRLTKELNINDELLCVHIDPASTKKFGEHRSTAGWNA